MKNPMPRTKQIAGFFFALFLFSQLTIALSQEKLTIKADRPWNTVAISGDNKLLAFPGRGYGERQIVVCDLETGKELFAFAKNEKMACTLVFSPTEPLLVSVSGTRVLNLWNLKEKSHTASLEGVSTAFRAAVFSRDGKILAILTAQNTVWLFDVGKRKVIDTIACKDGIGTWIDISPDDSWIAVPNAGGSVSVLDVKISGWIVGHRHHPRHHLDALSDGRRCHKVPKITSGSTTSRQA